MTDPAAAAMREFDALLDAYEHEIENGLDPELGAFQQLERELRDRRRRMVEALRPLTERTGRRVR